MLLTYIGRVLWARRFIILLATLASFAGGWLMLQTTAKRYDAANRVELQLIKPDPISGFHINAKNADAYVQTQVQEIRSYDVARSAAERLGWLDNPDLQQQYAALPAGTDVDFSHWVADRVIDGIYVLPVEDSNLLEIRFRAVSPEAARSIVAEVRNAYIDSTSAATTSAGQAGLPAALASVERSRARLADLEGRKGEFERQTGLVTVDRTSEDADIHRLNSLAHATPMPILRPNGGMINQAALQVSQLDDQIKAVSKTLGPNNPQIIELHRRRELAAKMADAFSPAKDVAQIVTEDHRRMQADLDAQKQKVLSMSEKRVQLHLLQDEIRREKMRYDKAAEQMQTQQRMSSGGGGIVAPVGLTEGSEAPAFPRPPLVLGGSTALGLVAGLLLAFMTEAVDRRVRVPNDLTLVAGRRLGTFPKVDLPIARSSWFRNVRRRREAVA